jgi:hypothetical protein
VMRVRLDQLAQGHAIDQLVHLPMVRAAERSRRDGGGYPDPERARPAFGRTVTAWVAGFAGLLDRSIA